MQGFFGASLVPRPSMGGGGGGGGGRPGTHCAHMHVIIAKLRRRTV